MKTTIQVEGMTCEHCKASVEGALDALAGVQNVAVALDAGTVGVTYNENKVTTAQMHDAIEEQGYDIKA